MKKSIIAVGVVAVVGLGWVAASWQSGKYIEANKDIYTEAANQQIGVLMRGMAAQNPKFAYMMPNLRLTLDSYERGLISSSARYYLSEPADKKPSERLYFTADIEHGPFPLSELIAFHLAPKGAVINVQLEKTPVSKPFFDLTNGKAPFLLKVVPGATATRNELSIAPIDHQGLKLDNINLSVIADHKLSQFESKFSLGTVAIDSPEASIYIDSLVVTSNLVKGQFTSYSGTMDMKTKSLSFEAKKRTFPPLPIITLDNVTYRINTGEDANNLNYAINLDLGDLKLNDYSLGHIQFNAGIKQIDGNAFRKLMTNLAQYSAEIEKDPEFMQEIILNNMEGLLQNSPVINISPVSWSNKGGTSTYSSTIALNAFSMAELGSLSEDQVLAKILKNANSDLTLSIPMIKEVVVNSVLAANLGSQEDAEKQFDQAISELPTYLKQFDKNNMMQIKGETVESKFSYADNTVTLNDNQIPLRDFISAIQ
jgi:uncharacterized protein YdgA (DUF945 family)